MKRMLRFQLSRMVRCREYRVAMLLSSLVACGAFLAEVVANWRLDRSAILSAGEVTARMESAGVERVSSALCRFLWFSPRTSFPRTEESVLGSV
ncbi:MAG: hypothetical protein ACLVHV_06605 [Oscillospiraceae bacterium]